MFHGVILEAHIYIGPFCKYYAQWVDVSEMYYQNGHHVRLMITHIKSRFKDMVLELLLYQMMCFLTCQRAPLLLLLHQGNLVLVLSPMLVFILHNFSCVQHIF